MHEKNNNKRKVLQNLWPAAMTGLLIACAASAMKPTLASVPELLEYTAPQKTETEEKPKLKDTAAISKLAKDKKKTKEKTVAEKFADLDSYADGTYTGSAQGFGGQITLQVVVKNGAIADISILSAPGETEPYFSQAKSVISQILSSGSPNVDTVSGATYSSNGILNAVKRALSSAGGNGATLTIVEHAPPAVDNSPAILTPVAVDPASIEASPVNALKDGIYPGSAQGFGGNISLQVTVSGGKISAINIVSASGETGSYFNRAQAVISSILTAQSADVDTVSGATYSSNGIKNAVRSALSQAVSSQTQNTSEPEKQPSDNPEKKPDQDQDQKTDKDQREEYKENPDIQKKDLDSIEATLEQELKDGTYRGNGQGFGGEIQLEITVKEGKIIQLEILSAKDETPAYFNKAKAILINILDQQSAQVDVISGASFSSEGILEALEDAMKQAEGKDDSEKEEADEKKEESEDKKNQTEEKDSEEKDSEEKDSEEKEPEEKDPAEETFLYKDGVFSATALCTDAEEDPEDYMFFYNVNLSITIENGQITEVVPFKAEDLSEDPEDNETYFSYASNGRTRKGVFYPGIVQQILEKQSAEELDSVSSATYTSRAMIQAARQALASAKS